MEESRFYILSARKLTGEITEEENRELDLIFLSNPLFEEIYKGLLNNIPAQENNKTLDEATLLHNLRAKLKSTDPDYEVSHYPEIIYSRSFLTKNKYNIIFSAMALLVITGFLYFPFFTTSNDLLPQKKISQNHISTKPGSKTQVTLPDGSIVILNADSKLTYPDNFLGDIREVTLEGEAFFDVSKNKDKPFIIHSATMDIKVLGTVFNVKAYPAENSSEASLISGSIEVMLKNRTNEKIMLKPNEKITVSNSAVANTNDATAKKILTNAKPLIILDKIKLDEKDNQANEIAWTQNKLIFNNEKIEDIIQLLERWYGVQIKIETQQLKGINFTGRFYNESLNQVLKALQMTHQFNYSNNNDQILIY